MEKPDPPQSQALVAPAKIPGKPSVLFPKKSSLEGTNTTGPRAGPAGSTVSAGLAPRLRLALNPGVKPVLWEAWGFPEGSSCSRQRWGSRWMSVCCRTRPGGQRPRLRVWGRGGTSRGCGPGGLRFLWAGTALLVSHSPPQIYTLIPTILTLRAIPKYRPMKNRTYIF